MLLPVISALFTGYVIASYVLARKPQLLHTVKRFPFPALHISHRGGAAENIENSKEAFTFAHAVGTQMFELDCQLTKDLQVVVFHDQSLERCTEGSGSISEYSYDNLPRYKQKLDLNFVPDTFCENSCDQPCQIVRLSDLFETFPTVPINIDIKIDDDRLVEAVSFSHHFSFICCW
ncbi:Glycerophosphodiester phosphodiesterase domain-containing protein 1 [Fasciola hepatica]|uniref:Glycerophosphodiester phosphodiesterase domain-containing protein 1 n=1 Tax=Fasciola hepatica TaxID=6192 RepID=A0A4E0RC82_FASHE|nr:Glycerophosphodiester phosphodiesterase domain-containing protein 1 [Fasciola hepatica]